MPGGKFALERYGLIGIRNIDEDESRSNELLPSIDAGEHEMVRLVDVHRVPAAGGVHVVHAHTGDIAQGRLESGSTGGLWSPQGGHRLLQ